MKNNKVSSNARKAFSDFKEELAKEMNLNFDPNKDKPLQSIIDKAKENFTNLGRS